MQLFAVRSLSPLAKIGTWVLLIAVSLLLIQSVAWLTGSDFNVLKNDATVLIVALATLLLLISADRRPISDYGLFVGPMWKQLWFRGVAAGVLSYLVYLVLAIALGVFAIRTDSLNAPRFLKATLSAMTSFPLAITQQLLFSGYLLSILRDRHHRLVAVMLSAALFALMNRLDNPSLLLLPATQQLMFGLFLAAALLGMLRLLTGSILVPAGVLAGWLFLRRFVYKLGLLAPLNQSPYYNWFAPGNDPRQAPMMALFLSLGIVICWVILRRKGEGRVPLSDQALNADFLRLFPFSHSNALTPLDVWVGRLVAARFRVGLVYVPRLLVILVLSTFNTVLTLPERLLLPLLVRRRHISDPVFIVGSHRSGTTHLHNLLALDPQFCTPRAYHMMNPLGCVFSGWLLMPVLSVFLPWKRPMDAVRFHLFSAQEEEFALAGSSRLSPYWGITFPKQWPEYDQFIFPHRLDQSARRAWQEQYLFFLRKVTFWSQKRLLLKNPYNTARVAILRDMFPQAKFIHICRHPYDTYRSNMHMAREGHVGNQLQDPDAQTCYQARFLGNYRAMEEAFQASAQQLPMDQVAQLRYEDMEHDPIGTIRQIYQQLGLNWSSSFQQRLERYLAEIADYRKNHHRPLSDEQRRLVDASMAAFIHRWGYDDDKPHVAPSDKAA